MASCSALYMWPCQAMADTTRAALQALPDFPPAEGETRPTTFRKVLLNTCQEEFEGTHEAREVSAALFSPDTP